jgi:hypothetical protein
MNLSPTPAVAFLSVLFSVTVVNAREITPAGPGETCGFEGNADMYGLGIRLGVYIQVSIIRIPTPYLRASLLFERFAKTKRHSRQRSPEPTAKSHPAVRVSLMDSSK